MLIDEKEKRLLALLRLALGIENGGGGGKYNWEEILALAKEHTVTGLVYAAAKKLPEAEAPPSDVGVSLMIEAEKIARHSRKVAAFSGRLEEELNSASLRPVLMKGHAVAKYYPEPEFRVCGDVDFYFEPSEFEAAVSFFESKGYSPQLQPDGSYFCHYGPGIDIHRNYYDLHVGPETLPPVPSSEALILMLSAHILKHAMGPGVGLRQICDLAVCLSGKRIKYDISALEKYFRLTRTETWNKVLLAFLSRHFGVETELYSGAFNRDKKLPRKIRGFLSSLERIVFRSGNFGRLSSSRKQAIAKSARHRKLDTFRRFVRNMPFSLRCAPHEFIYYTKSLTKGNMHSL